MDKDYIRFDVIQLCKPRAILVLFGVTTPINLLHRALGPLSVQASSLARHNEDVHHLALLHLLLPRLLLAV